MNSDTEQDHQALLSALEHPQIAGGYVLLPKDIYNGPRVPQANVAVELAKLRSNEPVYGSEALYNSKTQRYYCSLCLHRQLRETELITQPSQGNTHVDYFKCRICDRPFEVPGP